MCCFFMFMCVDVYFILELQHESFKGAQQFDGFALKKNGMLSKY